MRIVSAAVLCAGLSLTVAPVRAHHAFAAEFDSTKPVKLHGIVTKVEWINPHSWIHLDVKEPDGSVTSWMVEGGSPNVLMRRGVNRNSVPEGSEIVVNGYLAKDGTKRANGRDITFADGRKLFVSSSSPDEQPEKK